MDLRVSGEKRLGPHTLFFRDSVLNEYYSTASEFDSSDVEGTKVWRNFLVFNLDRQFNRLGYNLGFEYAWHGRKTMFRATSQNRSKC